MVSRVVNPVKLLAGRFAAKFVCFSLWMRNAGLKGAATELLLDRIHEMINRHALPFVTPSILRLQFLW